MSLGTACGDEGEGPPTATASLTTTDATGDGDGAGTSTGGTGDASESTGTTGEDPAWMTPYCYTVADKKWLAAWIEREEQVLARINAARAEGADCGSQGSFEPAGPLTLDTRLHCAARKHAQDMAERDFFDHVNPDGEDPLDRISRAGYTGWAAAGENIAAGSDDPATIVDGWLASDGHCANLMNPQYKETGVGFYEGAGSQTYYWTQTFGAPLE